MGLYAFDWTVARLENEKETFRRDTISMVRVNDLARELTTKSRAILDVLPLIGVTQKKTHSSSLEDWEAEKVRAHFRAHPENSSLYSRVSPQADAAASFLDRAKVSRPGDVLKATMQRPAMPAEGPGERSKFSPMAPLNPTVDAAATRPFHGSTVATDASQQDTGSSLEIPEGFSFYTRGFVDFDHVLKHFDWNLRGHFLNVDLSACTRSNFQALALLLQYAWYSTLNGCSVKFKYGTAQSGPTKMLASMGALDWRQVLVNDGRDFSNSPSRKTYALRRRSDVQSTINNARRAIRNYSIGFPEYLSYIISELLYNATEHGRRTAVVDNCQVLVPAIFQFGLYPQLNRLSFIFSDLGMGIKAHLEQSYPAFPTHQDAITYALRPNVSGVSAAIAAVRNSEQCRNGANIFKPHA